jgi:predicted HicB family RNase H-like nuclease
MTKKRLTFIIDDELHRAIKVTAAEKQCSMTALITHILYRTLYYKIEMSETFSQNMSVDNK